MVFDLKIGDKYIVKSGMPFFYEGRSYDNSVYFIGGKFYDKGIVFIQEIITLSPIFTKITFRHYRREPFNANDVILRYEEFSLPYFIVYDSTALEIPDAIHAIIVSYHDRGKGTEQCIKHSRFVEGIIPYDPVLNDRISHAERMIQNAENVKAKQLRKINRIYSEFILEKISFKDYNDNLKHLFKDLKSLDVDDLNVIEKKLDAHPSDESDGGLSKEQHE